MRRSVLAAIMASTFAMAGVVEACSSSDGGGSSGTVDPGNEAGSSSGSSGSSGTSGGPGEDGGDATADAARKDGDTELDGAQPDEGGSVDPPAVRMVGRFSPDGANAYFAYPGSKLIARFNGTEATVKLSQTDKFSVGHSWFDLTVDGVLQPKFEVNGTSVDYTVATGLSAGIHTVELEKRTEGNLGIVHYEGFTFGNGGTLLSPPARPTRRIEFLSDSTMDGFGIEGSRLNAGDANYCGDPSSAATNKGALPQWNDSKKSVAQLAAASVNAESYLIGYSGKGVTKNESAGDTLLFPTLYDRTLPDDATKPWDFTSWTPDAVVIGLGGTDYENVAQDGAGYGITPANFQANYDALVTKVRTNYPNAWIFMAVWSQIKDSFNPKLRTPMKAVYDAIVAAHPADTKLSVFVFNPEAVGGVDDTACEYHGTASHHALMATKLTAELQAKLGW